MSAESTAVADKVKGRPLHIFITGGARGIGRGLFRHFISRGNKVFVVDKDQNELEHLSRIARYWTLSGADFTIEPCDLQNRDHITRVAKRASEFFNGKLDVLINNAMPTPHIWSQERKMEDDEDDAVVEEWDEKLAVGLTAPFLLSRLCVPMLKATDASNSTPGTIINISSTRAYQSELDHEAYSAVKAGILGLTQSMAVSLGHRHNIRVNAIVPGWIHAVNENSAADAADGGKGTAWEEGLSKDDHEWHPAGRVGKAEDVARAVEYLIGSDFVTGQDVVVDGGVGRKMVYPE